MSYLADDNRYRQYTGSFYMLVKSQVVWQIKKSEVV